MMRMSLGEGPPVRVITLSLLVPLPSVASLGSSDSDNCFCFFGTYMNI